MTSVGVLEREMFAEAEAARLLGVAQGTLHYWLDGGTRRGRTYRPILRAEATNSRSVTWAEFVEAGLLRQYRRDLHVPMGELRAFIERLRETYGVPYPLADRRPYVLGRELVLQVQDEVGLDPEFCLVAAVRGQLILTAPSQRFLERVTWDGDVAVGWRPHEDPASPVLMTPDIRFGKPAIKGISTEVLWEHDEAGEDVHEIAEAFGLTVADVRWAVSYESSARAA
jgi:uncharacterized protein (DUF433 family)